jgi:succinate--hydroxymethylglutarate CoA-transferase
MSLPLQGLKVLAFEQYGAGPFGTQYLSDLGGEVIKVEPAGTSGDYLRDVGPYFLDDKNETDSSIFFQALNRNKKSITLDILSDEGKKVLEKLVSYSDAVCNNLRGDVPEKLGITYENLKKFNKKIVCAHCSAYGREGSRKNWPGFDYLMQAEAGYFSLTGEPEGPPSRFGLSIVDYMSGLTMAFSLVSAVLSARDKGKGRNIDVSLFDTALFNLNYLSAWSLNSNYESERLDISAHPVLVPCQLYKTLDGWIYLMCNKENFWPTLCQYIGREDLAEDKRFKNFKLRQKHRDLITKILDQELMNKTTKKWLEIFAGHVPAAPILNVREALDNQFVKERKNIHQLKTKDNKVINLLKTPINFEASNFVDSTAPKLGEHNDEIYNKIGLSTKEINHLKNKGII